MTEFTAIESVRQPEQPSNVPLTPKYAGRALFFSFKTSQGKLVDQDDHFKYLHAIRPTWRIPDGAFREEMEASAIRDAQNFIFKEGFIRSGPDGSNWFKRVFRYIKPPKVPPPYERHTRYATEGEGRNKRSYRLTEDIVADVIREKAEEMAMIFNSPDVEAKDEIVARLTKTIMARDKKFLIKGRSRYKLDAANLATGTESHPEIHPRASALIDHGMRGAKTGLKEFDQMFKDIKEYIQAEREKDSPEWKAIEPELSEIIRLYNEHHPKRQFSFAEIDDGVPNESNP